MSGALSAHGGTVRRLVLIEVTLEVGADLGKGWFPMKGFQGEECPRWSGVAKEHPTMSLEHGEHT